jgi:hypothetical protein
LRPFRGPAAVLHSGRERHHPYGHGSERLPRSALRPNQISFSHSQDPTTDGGPTEILHCTSPDLVTALRYAASLPNGSDLTELDQLKRRSFITLLGGAATWPIAVRAQQGERVRRIGVLMGLAESDPETSARLTKLREELGRLGWSEGSNLADYPAIQKSSLVRQSQSKSGTIHRPHMNLPCHVFKET